MSKPPPGPPRGPKSPRPPEQRVVVTGTGALSSLGLNQENIRTALIDAHSGIVHMPEWEELGFRSQVAGDVGHDLAYEEKCDASKFSRRQLDTMGPVAALCALATEDALREAGLLSAEKSTVLESRGFACLVGSGVSSMQSIYEGGSLAYAGKARRVRPHAILQGMSSTVSAHLVRFFGFGGRAYSISSACSTATHSIGHAAELIRGGLIDRAVAGGGDEVGALAASGFNALRAALSSGFNEHPHQASRPFDTRRDGFVLSGGAGVMVLESLASARERKAQPLLEILGFGANADAHDMILPEPEGRSASDCMLAALADAGLEPTAIDYINTHATGTPAGDIAEANAIRRVFGESGPAFSAPKALAGHALGGAGSLELIYTMLMIEGGFLIGSANLDAPDPTTRGLDLITSIRDQESSIHLSNSFGFGGTNATLIVGRVAG